MSGGNTVQVAGLYELKQRIKAATGSLQDLKDAGLAAAQPVAETARTLVPVLTGALEESIRASGQAGGAKVRAGYAALPYAGPIHFGWPAHNIFPHPFLYDALDQRRDDVIKIYEDQVGNTVDLI